MPITPKTTTVDTTDALGLARWWADRTGGEIVAENDGWYVVVRVPHEMSLAFQRVDEPTSGKNRLHLDLVADDLDTAVAELREAGAGLVAEREISGFRWFTLTDPDGNQFCVSAAADHTT